MRAPHIFDRTLMGFRVVESDPAGKHFRWHDPIVVAVVLMEAERLCPRRFPDNIVLPDPRARPAAQFCRCPAYVGSQHDRCYDKIRFPSVADLPSEIVAIPPQAPIPLIGIEPRLELARKQGFETASRRLDRRPVKNVFYSYEPIPVELLDIVLGE